jgi:hypothetical protein
MVSMRLSFNISVLGFNHTEHQTAEAGIAIDLRSRISLRNNWRLVTATTVHGHTWTSDPVIKARGLTIPIKPAAELLAPKLLAAIGEAVDKSMADGMSIRQFLTPIWEGLQTPHKLSAADMPEPVWLRLDPSAIYMTQPVGRGRTVTASLGIRAAAETFFGEQPEPRTPKPLPDFLTPEEPDSAFAINLYSEISYENATAICREAFVGRTFRSGLQRVTVHDIEVTGAADGLARIRMVVSGSLKGTVTVTGRPVFNESRQTLSLADFDFDVETDSRFQKSRNWLLRGVIASKMKPHMRFPLKDTLDDYKILAQNMLTDYELYRGIVLNGRIDSLAVRGVELGANEFRVAVVATGAASVTQRR